MRIRLTVFLVLCGMISQGQETKKFYQDRTYWRDINKGFWWGVSGNYQRIGTATPLPILPTLHIRHNYLSPRFYMSMEMNFRFKINTIIKYKTVSEQEFRTAQFPYQGVYFDAGVGYYLRHFFWGKGVYGLAIGGNYGIFNVGGVDMNEIQKLDKSGESLDVQRFGGTGSEIKPYLLLDRYLWLKNKQMAIQVVFSRPIYQSIDDPIYNYLRRYLFYQSSGNSVSLRFLYNLSPTVRYNPTKMSEL